MTPFFLKGVKKGILYVACKVAEAFNPPFFITLLSPEQIPQASD